MPEQWTISLGAERREARRHLRDHPRGPGRVRAAQPPARRPRRGTTGFYDDVGRAGARHRARARREHPRRHLAGEARQAEAGVRKGRDGDRRQLLAAQRRRRRDAARPTRRGARTLGREPLARIVGRGVGRRRSRRVRDRARSRRPTGRWSAPASAGTTSPRSSSTRRSRRSAWPTCRSGPSSIPRSVNPQRRRDRDRTSARRLGRADPRLARARAQAPRRRLRRRRDLHRRRPRPGRGAGGIVLMDRGMR